MSGVQGLQGRNGMPSYTQVNNDKSFTNEKLEKRFPFWRERGTICLGGWWKVECCMFE